MIMAALERTYTIPLRREWLKVAKYKRANKAVRAIREFLVKHMKGSDVKLGQELNLLLWKRGIKSPPGYVKVTAKRNEEGVVFAELFGIKVEEPKKVPAAKKEKSMQEQLAELKAKSKTVDVQAKKVETADSLETLAGEVKVDEKKQEATPKENKAAPKKKPAHKNE